MQMDARHIFNIAVNDGNHYEFHKQLVRRNAIVNEWKNHLQYNILSDYRKQFGYECGIEPAELQKAARLLQDYYIQHMKECNS